MVQLNASRLLGFIRKSSKTQVISVACECLLNLFNVNVPVAIRNRKSISDSTQCKTTLEKISAVILSKQGFYLISYILYFCLKKHTIKRTFCLKSQSNIKNAIIRLEPLRHMKSTTTNPPVIPTPVTLINATVENNHF